MKADSTIIAVMEVYIVVFRKGNALRICCRIERRRYDMPEVTRMSSDIEMDQNARFHGAASSDHRLWPCSVILMQEKIESTGSIVDI